MQHAGYGVSGTSLQRRPRYSTECTLFTTWSALYYWLIEAKLTIVGQEWRFRKIPRKDVNIQPSLFSVHQVKCPSLLINRNQKPTRCVWHKWRVPGMNIPPLVHVPHFLLWLDGFSSNFQPLTPHACVTHTESLVKIGQQWNALYMENKVPFHVHLGFRRRDFPKTSYLEISTHAVHTMWVR